MDRVSLLTHKVNLNDNHTSLSKLYDQLGTTDEKVEFFKKNKETFQYQHRITNVLSDFTIGLLVEDLIRQPNAEARITELIETLSINRSGKNRELTVLNAIIADRAMIDTINHLSKDLKSKITSKNLRELLQFNNFRYDSSGSGGKRKKESYIDYLERVNMAKGKKIPAINGTIIAETDVDKEKKAVEYTKYYNKKHGRLGVVFLESYDITMETPEFQEFIKTYPEPTVIPAFHGTGTIAANMILRFGFKILTNHVGGVVATGKALGDGIYFSDVLSKTMQYLGDSGYSRSSGTIGYILEMDAYLGKENVDYKSAGYTGATSYNEFRSPEWCVFNPRAQLKIIKAHKVKLVNETVIESLKTKYPSAIKEDRYFKRFKEYALLNEAEMTKKPDTLIYMFYDGTIPVEADKAVDADEFEKKYGNNKILVDPSQKGPAVSLKIQTTESAGYVHVPNTDRFMREDPDGICSRFLTLIEKLK